MRFLREEIVFQEVPNETSLLFHITNCPHNCNNCHARSINKADVGQKLTDQLFTDIILKYRNLVTCILFWGGEWEEDQLFSKLKIAQDHYFKTCLYSGQITISEQLRSRLNYVKLGPYIPHLGGLESSKTNQVFINLDTGERLNHYFQTTQQTIKIKEEFYDYLNY